MSRARPDDRAGTSVRRRSALPRLVIRGRRCWNVSQQGRAVALGQAALLDGPRTEALHVLGQVLQRLMRSVHLWGRGGVRLCPGSLGVPPAPFSLPPNPDQKRARSSEWLRVWRRERTSTLCS